MRSCAGVPASGCVHAGWQSRQGEATVAGSKGCVDSMNSITDAVVAFCGLVALTIVLVTLRPAASTAVCDVLKTLGAVLASVSPWASKRDAPTQQLEPIDSAAVGSQPRDREKRRPIKRSRSAR
jgi:hypothetical protein